MGPLSLTWLQTVQHHQRAERALALAVAADCERRSERTAGPDLGFPTSHWPLGIGRRGRGLPTSTRGASAMSSCPRTGSAVYPWARSKLCGLGLPSFIVSLQDAAVSKIQSQSHEFSVIGTALALRKFELQQQAFVLAERHTGYACPPARAMRDSD
eukprot:356960-Chlamydomonas_euryale.AAC.1